MHTFISFAYGFFFFEMQPVIMNIAIYAQEKSDVVFIELCIFQFLCKSELFFQRISRYSSRKLFYYFQEQHRFSTFKKSFMQQNDSTFFEIMVKFPLKFNRTDAPDLFDII